MDTLELTRENIRDNEQITILDISNPLTVDDGDYFHVYIGISATSLCEVDLEITDGFIGGYGSISLERLTRQTNMYALHFSLDSYLYDYQEPQYRNSEFFITAYTCGELSEEAKLSISQKGCEHTCAIIKCILTSGGSLDNTSELSGFTFGEGVSYLDIEVMQDKVNVICSGNCISELGNNNTGSTFQDDDLVEIILPETLTILHGSDSDNEGIFSYSGLKKADLSNIEEIGAWTFEGCEFYAILPNTSSEIDYYDNLGGCAIVSSALTKIGESAFGSNYYLRKVELPSGVTRLYRTFHDCHSLTAVTLPNSTTEIGNEAFKRCEDLPTITIPDSVTSIGYGAFYKCSSLASVTIGNGVTSIGYGAFSDCGGLTSVTIPNSVTSIGEMAFYGCSGLKSVNITDIAAWCNIAFSRYNSNPLCYAKHLYVNNVEVTNLVIPEGVTSIGGAAFYNCSSLTSVAIPNSVTSIGGAAFQYCSSLTSVAIPNSVTSIGNGAFNGCSSLASVTIGNGVTNIGYVAFGYCVSLRTVTCKSGNPPTIETGTFDYDTLTNGVLHVPSGLASTYRSRGWTFSNIVEDA